jgi:cation transport regulator ChaB
MKAEQQAWASIKDKYDEDENGVWSKAKAKAKATV